MPSPRPSAARPARQPRSLATQERILAAAEALLAEGDADAITMERVAERAHVSIGAIYKRLQGKASLLPLVLARVQAQQLDRLQAFLAQPRWRGADLAARIHGVLQVFAEAQMQQRRLIRALVVGHWRSDDRGGGEADAAKLMGAIHAWLSERADEIAHPDPRLALSLGMFTALQTLQTAILLDRIPPQLGLERFTAEIARMFRHYLAAGPADGRPDVAQSTGGDSDGGGSAGTT
jgi:AcrR family transcriptional regulator